VADVGDEGGLGLIGLAISIMTMAVFTSPI